jgi:hypothetical protein
MDIIMTLFDSCNMDVIGNCNFEVPSTIEKDDKKDYISLRPVRQLKDSTAKCGKLFLHAKARYAKETLDRVVFGVSLESLMQRENHKGLVIPSIIFKCLKILHPESYTSQGVFRVSGNNKSMQEVELQFDLDCINYEFEKNEDIHVVACILKKYLR